MPTFKIRVYGLIVSAEPLDGKRCGHCQWASKATKENGLKVSKCVAFNVTLRGKSRPERCKECIEAERKANNG